jgi:hypothetical protein
MYEKASSQTINHGKTSIFFSKSTRCEFWDHVLSIAGASTSRSFDRYLGLPALVGREKRRTFMVSQDVFEPNYEGGSRNFYPKLERSFLSKQLFRPSLLIV